MIFFKAPFFAGSVGAAREVSSRATPTPHRVTAGPAQVQQVGPSRTVVVLQKQKEGEAGIGDTIDQFEPATMIVQPIPVCFEPRLAKAKALPLQRREKNFRLQHGFCVPRT